MANPPALAGGCSVIVWRHKLPRIPAVKEVSMAKNFATRVSDSVTYEAVQIFGGMGLCAKVWLNVYTVIINFIYWWRYSRNYE